MQEKKHYLKTVNTFFENVVKFKYLGMTVTIKIALMKILRAD
jgi:hypothetical protein